MSRRTPRTSSPEAQIPLRCPSGLCASDSTRFSLSFLGIVIQDRNRVKSTYLTPPRATLTLVFSHSSDRSRDALTRNRVVVRPPVFFFSPLRLWVRTSYTLQTPHLSDTRVQWDVPRPPARRRRRDRTLPIRREVTVRTRRCLMSLFICVQIPSGDDTCPCRWFVTLSRRLLCSLLNLSFFFLLGVLLISYYVLF